MGQRRDLIALRVELSPPPGRTGIWEAIIHRGYDPSNWPTPPAGKRWRDVQAGDMVIDRDRTPREVLAVRIFIARGGSDGDLIVSGRDWLATGRVLAPGR